LQYKICWLYPKCIIEALKLKETRQEELYLKMKDENWLILGEIGGTKMEADKIRIGVVGTGCMGRARAETITKNLNAEIACICAVPEETAKVEADKYGVEHCSDFEELLKRDDIQAVTLSIPNALHASFSIKALRAGKHVCVEYPMAISIEEADEMIKVAKETKRVLHPGLTGHFEPRHVAMKENLDAIGPLITTSGWLWLGGPVKPERNTWYMDPTQRGDTFTFLNHHHVDQFRDLFGEIEWVHGTLHDVPLKERPDRLKMGIGVLSMGFKNSGCAHSTQGHVHTGTAPYPNPWIIGEEGSIGHLHKENKVIVKTTAGEKEIPLPGVVSTQVCTDNFVKEIRGECAVVCPAEDTRQTILVTTKGAESARNGKRIWL